MRNLALACACLMAGCAGKPERFEVGSSISLGQGRLTVTRTEVHPDGKQHALMVFFTWTGPVKDLYGWFPSLVMTVTDAQGKSYGPVAPMFYSTLRPMPEDVFSLDPGASSLAEYKTSMKRRARNLEDMMKGPVHDREVLMQSGAGVERRIGQAKADIEAGRNPERWVHKFSVPQQSRGFTLLVRNPSPRKGQPRLVTVVLER